MGEDRRRHDRTTNIPENQAAPVQLKFDIPHIASMFCGWATPSPYFFPHPFNPGELLRAVSGTEAPYYEPWKSLRTTDREPSIGYYDERQPEIGRWYAENLKTGGFSVACFQIGHSHEQTAKMPDWLPKLESPLLYTWGPDNHPVSSDVKFCLSNWDAATGDEGPAYFKALIKDRGWTTDDLVNSMRVFGRNVAAYMLRPDYWLVDGRPVLYRGWAHTLPWYQEKYGFDITASQIIDLWREEIKASVGTEPFLVATSCDPVAHDQLKAWGFSGLTQYLLHGKGWADAMGVYRYWWARDLATCRKHGLKYIVPVTAGYDGKAWDTPEYRKGETHIPTATEFEAHVRDARKLASANRDICIGIGAYAGTEYGEGGIIMPTKRRGDELLRAHQAVLQ